MMTNPHPLRAKVRIVLVETSHPGNIGAAARAMKNMGLDRLYLVQPVVYPNYNSVFLSSLAISVLSHFLFFSILQSSIIASISF